MGVDRNGSLESWDYCRMNSGPVFTKLFRFRIKIRVKFQNE